MLLGTHRNLRLGRGIQSSRRLVARVDDSYNVLATSGVAALVLGVMNDLDHYESSSGFEP